jgi:hypothetical protein
VQPEGSLLRERLHAWHSRNILEYRRPVTYAQDLAAAWLCVPVAKTSPHASHTRRCHPFARKRRRYPIKLITNRTHKNFDLQLKIKEQQVALQQTQQAERTLRLQQAAQRKQKSAAGKTGAGAQSTKSTKAMAKSKAAAAGAPPSSKRQRRKQAAATATSGPAVQTKAQRLSKL